MIAVANFATWMNLSLNSSCVMMRITTSTKHSISPGINPLSHKTFCAVKDNCASFTIDAPNVVTWENVTEVVLLKPVYALIMDNDAPIGESIGTHIMSSSVKLLI